MPHDAEHPPDAGGAEKPGTVIDDHAVAVAKSHAAHTRREFLRARQHVRIGAVEIANLVDIEEDSIRNVLALIFLAGVSLHLRQVP